MRYCSLGEYISGVISARDIFSLSLLLFVLRNYYLYMKVCWVFPNWVSQDKFHSCTGTAPGILVTRTRRFPAPGSLGAGTKRPLFYGSFLGNLGAFRELLGNLLLPLPFYWELLQAPDHAEAKIIRKVLKINWMIEVYCVKKSPIIKISIESINNAIFYFQGYINKERPHLLNV